MAHEGRPATPPGTLLAGATARVGVSKRVLASVGASDAFASDCGASRLKGLLATGGATTPDTESVALTSEAVHAHAALDADMRATGLSAKGEPGRPGAPKGDDPSGAGVGGGVGGTGGGLAQNPSVG